MLESRFSVSRFFELVASSRLLVKLRRAAGIPVRNVLTWGAAFGVGHPPSRRSLVRVWDRIRGWDGSGRVCLRRFDCLPKAIN